MAHTDDEFAALDATGCKEHVKIVLAVLSAFKLVKDGILSEGAKALGANKTMLVPHLAACWDDRTNIGIGKQTHARRKDS